MIDFKEDKFFCSTCGNNVTIKSENSGKGISARCKICQKTLYYPICEECSQPVWNHDEEKHEVATAEKIGLRYCRKCKKKKNPDQFNMNGSVRSARCKSCQSEYFAEWYAKKTRTAKDSESNSNFEDVLNDLFG